MELLKHAETIVTILTLLIIVGGAVLGGLKGKKFSLKNVELPPVPIKLPENVESRLEAIEENLALIEKNTRTEEPGNTPISTVLIPGAEG